MDLRGVLRLVAAVLLWGPSGEILESQFPESHELIGTRGIKVEDVCGERVLNLVLLKWRETHLSPSFRPHRRPSW